MKLDFFEKELNNKFRDIFDIEIFNSDIVIQDFYIKKLEEKGIKYLLIRAIKDIDSILGYEILPYGDILNLDKNDNNISTYFVKILDYHKQKDEMIIVNKNSLIYYPVKKYIRNLKLNKINEL